MNDDNPLKIIYDNLDPWMAQMPKYTRDELFAGILSSLKDQSAFFSFEDDLVIYFVPENPWLVKMHFYSKNHSYKSVKALRTILKRVFENSTFEKFVGITPLRKFVLASEKTGIGKLEGVLTKAHKTESGELIDLYVFGVSREDVLGTNLL